MAARTILELAMDPRIRQGRSRNREWADGKRAAAWIGGLAAACVAVTGAATPILLLAPPSYRAEAQVLIVARSFGLIGLRPQILAADRGTAARDVTKGQAQLVASRDLARRAIEDLGIAARPEFDSTAGGSGVASRLLVLLGLKRDPDRTNRPDRILQAYEERLRISAEPKSRLITIAFESEDRDFAARAANRIADLYLEMRADTEDRGRGMPEARVVSRAVSPRDPIFPPQAWAVALGLSAIFATAFATLVTRGRLRASRHGYTDKPVEQPRQLGPTGRLAGLDQSAPERASPTPPGPPGSPAADAVPGIAAVVQRILLARRGPCGDIVLVTSCTEVAETARFVVDLARRVGEESRAIVVGLDVHQRLDVALRLPEPRAGAPRHRRCTARICDLAESRVSFAEVIARDPTSRLHYLGVELGGRRDLTGSESVFEALAETYDFVFLVAPPLDRDEAATTLACAADCVLLVTPPQANDIATAKAETALLDHGARAVDIVALPTRLRRSIASCRDRDAA
jgi:capsular polysaccharide biosynthesis protein